MWFKQINRIVCGLLLFAGIECSAQGWPADSTKPNQVIKEYAKIHLFSFYKLKSIIEYDELGYLHRVYEIRHRRHKNDTINVYEFLVFGDSITTNCSLDLIAETMCYPQTRALETGKHNTDSASSNSKYNRRGDEIRYSSYGGLSHMRYDRQHRLVRERVKVARRHCSRQPKRIYYKYKYA